MGQRIQGGRCETVCPCRNACLKGLGKSLWSKTVSILSWKTGCAYMNYCGFILTPLLFWYPNALYTIGYPDAGTICIVSRGFLDYVLNCSLSVCQILRWNIVCTGTWFRLLLPAELAATCLFPVLGDWCGPSNLLTSAGPRFDLVLDLGRNRVYTLVANSISIWFWSRVCHADLRWKPYLNDAFFINGEPWCAMLFWCQKHNHNSYDELLQRMVSEIACAIGIWDEERCSWLTKNQSKG